MVRTHGPVPVHAPVHPKKIEPTDAVAVKVTDAPDPYEWLHDPGELQLKPLPSVRLPEPVPVKFTVKVGLDPD